MKCGFCTRLDGSLCVVLYDPFAEHGKERKKIALTEPWQVSDRVKFIEKCLASLAVTLASQAEVLKRVHCCISPIRSTVFLKNPLLFSGSASPSYHQGSMCTFSNPYYGEEPLLCKCTLMRTDVYSRVEGSVLFRGQPLFFSPKS